MPSDETRHHMIIKCITNMDILDQKIKKSNNGHSSSFSIIIHVG